MLGRKKEPEPGQVEAGATKVEVKEALEGQALTFLSADAHFKGSLSYEKGLQIEGSFEGDITTKGRLQIGKGAKVKAEIKAGSVFVEGSVTGNITASDKIELQSTARVSGDMKAAKLVVEEGAMLAGRCEVSLKPVEREGVSVPVSRGFDFGLTKPPVEATQGVSK